MKLIQTIKQYSSRAIKSNNSLSLIGNLSFAALGFASFLMLSRILSLDDFGTWVLYITLATFTDLFRFGLTRSAVIHFAAGTSNERKKEILASSFSISLIETVICTLLLFPLYYILAPMDISRGYMLFLLYYPLLAAANMQWNNALSMLQAQEAFAKILAIRSMVAGLFLIGIAAASLRSNVSATDIIWVNIIANAIPSVYSSLMRYDGLRLWKYSSVQSIKALFHYGKYSIGTIAGSSLLRSADTFIIGLSTVIGASGIALYAIPIKLIEIVEIPLRSFCATAFPRMSALYGQNDRAGVRKVFYAYSSLITAMLLPFLIIVFIWGSHYAWMLGGEQFRNSAADITIIVQIFAVYGLLLPVDRLTGVALDSINRPKLNMAKVLWMLTANITGDLIAVFYFQSLSGVAATSVAFTLVGIFVGLQHLNTGIRISVRDYMSQTRTSIQNYTSVLKSALR